MAWRPLLLTVSLLAVLAGGSAQARSPAPPQSVAALEQRLAARPDDLDATLTLAAALLDRTRSSSDSQMLARANALATKALKAAPNNPAVHTLDARRLMVVHRFGNALDAVIKAEALGAADVATLSTKADALTELGRYEEAEAVIQKLLDQHYGPAALSRAAHFRFLYGDLEGAIELAKRSLKGGRLPPFDQAWLMLQVAELSLIGGDLEGAKRATLAAESAAPAAALALRARISEAQGKPEKAATLLRAAVRRELLPEFVVELWRLARQRGDLGEAARQGALLEGMARLDEVSGALNRRLFAAWYAEQDGRLATAERLARAELAARPDIYSHDLLAWALHRQGRSREALPYAERAIALGTPDVQLRSHAAAIFSALDDPRGAALAGAAQGRAQAPAAAVEVPAVAHQ